MLNFIKNATAFWSAKGNVAVSFLERYRLTSALVRGRFIIACSVYFFAHFGQELFAFDSISRTDFYFIGMSIFHLLIVAAVLINSLRSMNLFSVVLLFSFSVYLLFEVYNQACCAGLSTYWQEATLTCIFLFIGGLIGFSILIDEGVNPK